MITGKDEELVNMSMIFEESQYKLMSTILMLGLSIFFYLLLITTLFIDKQALKKSPFQTAHFVAGVDTMQFADICGPME
ncbi:hypothetical protein ACJX0J_010996, partial [Zea mays]